MNALNYALSAFVMLVVTVGPLSTAALFAGMTAHASGDASARIAVQGVSIATGVLALFGLVGEKLLGLLHVTTAAFELAGGLLLLLIAVDLVFAKPSGVSSLTSDEKREAVRSPDIAVFPLAIPLLAGPGAMTAMVLIVQHASGATELVTAFGVLAAVMACSLAALLMAPRVTRLLGVTGVNVASRISGILLAAVAMQFALNGWNAGVEPPQKHEQSGAAETVLGFTQSANARRAG